MGYLSPEGHAGLGYVQDATGKPPSEASLAERQHRAGRPDSHPASSPALHGTMQDSAGAVVAVETPSHARRLAAEAQPRLGARGRIVSSVSPADETPMKQMKRFETGLVQRLSAVADSVGIEPTLEPGSGWARPRNRSKISVLESGRRPKGTARPSLFLGDCQALLRGSQAAIDSRLCTHRVIYALDFDPPRRVD